MAKKKKGQSKPKGTPPSGDGARKADAPEEEREQATPSAAEDAAEDAASTDASSDEPAAAERSAGDGDDEGDAEIAARSSDASKPQDASDEGKSGSPIVGHEKLVGAKWAEPLVKLDRGWTWFETRLLVVVLLSLVFFMVTWISLKGLALPLTSDSKAGMAFRVLFGLAIAGGLGQLVGRRMPETRRNALTFAAMLVGAGVAPLWRAKGVTYAEHLLNWLQEGSSLTMFGGLRGVSTRLTILLALLGASLAAASGKHINIDVVLRFLNPKIRRLVFILSTLATLLVCVSAAWGFFDYVSIESFDAKNDDRASTKIEKVEHEVGQDLFLWRKQMGLDVSAAFYVLGGGKWDDQGRMNGRQWNQFVEEGGYREHFTKEEVDALLAPQEALDQPRTAQIVVPGGSPRGLLLHALDLIWCWGLVNIGLRFVLRMLLVASGHASADPEPDEFEGVVPSDEETEAEASAIAGTDDEEAA